LRSRDGKPYAEKRVGETGDLPEVYFGKPEELPQLPYRRGVLRRRRHRVRETAAPPEQTGESHPSKPVAAVFPLHLPLLPN
jgi:hypothetical protein